MDLFGAYFEIRLMNYRTDAERFFITQLVHISSRISCNKKILPLIIERILRMSAHIEGTISVASVFVLAWSKEDYIH